MPKTRSEIEAFMNSEWLATFCTVDASNAPHAVPVFFTYEAGKVYVQTARDTRKVRNLLQNPNVAVTVYSAEEAVVIRGRARVVDNEEFVTRTQEHIRKYGLRLDKQGRDSYGIPLLDSRTRCVVEVTPKRTLFW